jgi:DNA polymerase III epsilon subunit-like protein
LHPSCTGYRLSEKPGRYLIVDTETTGLHPARHGLIELAAAALDGQLALLDTFQADVCPPEGVEFDPEALQVNGFTMERIRTGISYRMVCEQFLGFMSKNFSAEPIVIGQFYPFDYAFLEQVFSTCGYRDGLSAAIKGNDFIDTKALANSINMCALLKGQSVPFPVTSLSKPGGLKELCGVTAYQAHSALGDVLATREVLIKLLEMNS